jgi:hypothetical protein
LAKTDLVAAIQAELRETEARANALRQALQAVGGRTVAAVKATAGRVRRRRRKMSAAARKAVSRRMKARWAAARKSGKKSLKG